MRSYAYLCGFSSLVQCVLCAVTAFDLTYAARRHHVDPKSRTVVAATNAGQKIVVDSTKNVASSAAKGGFVGALTAKIIGATSHLIRIPSKTTVIATVLAILLMREWWGNLPSWLRRGFGSLFRFRRKVSRSIQNDSSTSVNDLTDLDDEDNGLAIVAKKMQNVLKKADEKFDAIEYGRPKLSGFQQQMAMITTLILVQQAKEQTGDFWDRFRGECGAPLQLHDEERAYLRNLLLIADWAYVEETLDITRNLRKVNFTMVRHARADAPGRVGHFIAIDEKKKIALISVKGTSSLSDFVTDACGTPVRYNIPSGPYEVGGPAVISCHEGVLDASLDLLQDIQPLVEHLFLPSGFKVLLTGHSLGAGVAVIVGAMLRSRLTQLQTMGKKGLEVIVFAPPPTLNYVAAKATSSFTTSVVNGVDVVPRASINNAVTMLEFLNVVYSKLIDKGLAPKNLKATFELLSKLFKNEGTTIMSPDELFKALTDSASKGDVLAIDHLYVPGKVVYIYEKPTDNSTITTNATTAESSYQSFSAAIETDGACAMLQHIDIDQKMLDDHMVFAYKKTLDGFPSSKIG